MDDSIRSIRPEEKKYLYAQSQQLEMQCGAIGYLRGDFDSNGKGFFTTWFEQNSKLKTDEFKSEIDEVINDMRTGLLENRSAMSKYCREHPESGFKGSCCTEYGFRRDTEKYTYLLRCNPSAGNYNFYCWCFVKDWLDSHLEKASGGIRFIDSNYKDLFRIEDGDNIIITLDTDEKLTRTCRFIDEAHVEVGESLYHTCQFAEIMERNGNTYAPEKPLLPEVCHSTLPSNGELIVIKYGGRRYLRSEFSTDDAAQNRMFADDRNKKQGVTKAQEAAMLAGSMYGWSCPAANPKNYNRQGHPIKPDRKKDRGDAR